MLLALIKNIDIASHDNMLLKVETQVRILMSTLFDIGIK